MFLLTCHMFHFLYIWANFLYFIIQYWITSMLGWVSARENQNKSDFSPCNTQQLQFLWEHLFYEKPLFSFKLHGTYRNKEVVNVFEMAAFMTLFGGKHSTSFEVGVIAQGAEWDRCYTCVCRHFTDSSEWLVTKLFSHDRQSPHSLFMIHALLSFSSVPLHLICFSTFCLLPLVFDFVTSVLLCSARPFLFYNFHLLLLFHLVPSLNLLQFSLCLWHFPLFFPPVMWMPAWNEGGAMVACCVQVGG